MKEITGKTTITGIFGYPLSHSLSPAMHNNAFRALGLNYIYLPFTVNPQDLPLAVKALLALGIRGINVTIPHKEAVLELLDEISQEAQLIGAVNTIVVEGSKLLGFNTDGSGFLTSLQEFGFEVEGKKILVLGTGGSSRAVAMTLCWNGVSKLHLVARNVKKAEKLLQDINNCSSISLEASTFNDLSIGSIGEADLIINTTPVGMSPNIDSPSLLNTKSLHPGQFVYDLIYNPLETTLLKEAKGQGCLTMNGLGMLIHQGAQAFSLWTEKTAPLEVMREAVLENVGISRKKLP